MELEGELEEIIYSNEENSYTIATLATEEEIFTVVRISSIYKQRRLSESKRKICYSSRLWKAI